MDIRPQPKLKFKGVDFPYVEMNSKSPYVADKDGEIEVDIQPKVFLPKDKVESFNIIMDVKLVAEGFFELNVTGIGYFKLSGEDITEDDRRKFINANSTAILFPYIRAFISTLTSNLGKVTSPILLPTQFFKGDIPEYQPEEQP